MNRQVEFCSHVGNLSLVRNFVRQFLTQLGCLEPDCDMIVLGIDEACTNVIRHAYGNREDQLICLRLERLDCGHFRCRLRDYAGPSAPETFHGRELEDVRPGGLGLHLIQRVFDQVSYTCRGNGTELVMTKALSQPEQAPAPALAPQPRRQEPSSTANSGSRAA